MVAITRSPVRKSGTTGAWNGRANRKRPLRVLFVHSNLAGVKQCLQELNRSSFKVIEDVIRTSNQFAERLDSKPYDIVAAEYCTADRQGRRALKILRSKNKQIPLIFLTGAISRETVAKLMTEGAADCVEMNHVGRLPVAIRRALSENNLRQERDLSEQKLRHSEARYRALVGNMRYGICRCGSDGKFLDVNQALVTMLGYSSKEELLASSYARDILCDPIKRAQILGRTDHQERFAPLEVCWERNDGTTLRVQLSGREVREEGNMEGCEIIVEDVTEQRKLEDHLRQQAATDALTGLANYRHLVKVMDGEIKRSERTSREFAVLFLDLNGLKQINDTFGHVVGNHALCRLADILGNSTRDLDTVARFGGDEFAIMLPETGAEAAAHMGRRICSSLANDGGQPQLSVSTGIAVYPKDGKTIETLVSAADTALYATKSRRRHAIANSRGSATWQRTARKPSKALNLKHQNPI